MCSKILTLFSSNRLGSQLFMFCKLVSSHWFQFLQTQTQATRLDYDNLQALNTQTPKFHTECYGHSFSDFCPTCSWLYSMCLFPVFYFKNIVHFYSCICENTGEETKNFASGCIPHDFQNASPRWQHDARTEAHGRTNAALLGSYGIAWRFSLSSLSSTIRS